MATIEQDLAYINLRGTFHLLEIKRFYRDTYHCTVLFLGKLIFENDTVTVYSNRVFSARDLTRPIKPLLSEKIGTITSCLHSFRYTMSETSSITTRSGKLLNTKYTDHVTTLERLGRVYDILEGLILSDTTSNLKHHEKQVVDTFRNAGVDDRRVVELLNKGEAYITEVMGEIEKAYMNRSIFRYKKRRGEPEWIVIDG